jgi:hypothetical protein
MAIKSRGETLTFREGSYWDFLDEDADEKPIPELKEAWDDMVELEYEDLTFDIGDGEELTTKYTYETFKEDVELYITEKLLTEEDVKDLPNGSELLKEGGPELDAFVSEHFDELFNKYYDTILEHNREDAERHAYENFDYYDYLDKLDSEWGDFEYTCWSERDL